MANDITTEDQEMGGAKKLSKSAIRRAYWDWLFYNLSVQNFERMQGPAIIKMLADVREDLYPGDPEAQQEMLERHEVFFNTEPYLGSIVPGIVLGMEASKAEGNDEISSEFINSIKTALMGPFAGIGDSLLPGTLIPILLSIALACHPTARSLARFSTSWSSWPSCCRSPGSSSPMASRLAPTQRSWCSRAALTEAPAAR